MFGSGSAILSEFSSGFGKIIRIRDPSPNWLLHVSNYLVLSVDSVQVVGGGKLHQALILPGLNNHTYLLVIYLLIPVNIPLQQQKIQNRPFSRALFKRIF